MKTYSEADFRVKCDSMFKDDITNKILKLYENQEIKFKDKNNKYYFYRKKIHLIF